MLGCTYDVLVCDSVSSTADLAMHAAADALEDEVLVDAADTSALQGRDGGLCGFDDRSLSVMVMVVHFGVQ